MSTIHFEGSTLAQRSIWAFGMRSQQSKRYLGLGDYAGVVDSLLRVMTYDALVGTSSRSSSVARQTARGRLLLCGALNAAHDEYSRNRLSKDPFSLQNRRWVAKHVGVGLAAFLLYPAIAWRATSGPGMLGIRHISFRSGSQFR